MAAPAEGLDPAAVTFVRCTVDLGAGTARVERLACRNLEDVLGGIGRAYQLLAERDIRTAYCPENPLVVSTGLLTGSAVMTGLRTYFSAYSPLKHSDRGLPAAMWAAGSDKFGARLKWTGIDEVVFEGRSPRPVYALFRAGPSGPQVQLLPAEPLLGLDTHRKIMALHQEHPDAHFAVIGPGGEHYESVYMGAVALSTENQFKSGQDKCRFAGRGGMGSVMGYKNLIALAAAGPDQVPPVTPEVLEVNKTLLKPKAGGSTRYQPVRQGGGGGTWANLEVMQAFRAAPENNFRPKAHQAVEGLFRRNVEKDLEVRSEACFRCGIRCHNNVFERTSEGPGRFIAKFDYEPLNLFGSNLGLHDGPRTAELVKLADNLGLDAISAATTLAYVLDYNERHPDAPLLNGATFGQFERIRDLLRRTGEGLMPEIGRGVKRLSRDLGETAYAMHVKGLELPAPPPGRPGGVRHRRECPGRRGCRRRTHRAAAPARGRPAGRRDPCSHPPSRKVAASRASRCPASPVNVAEAVAILAKAHDEEEEQPAARCGPVSADGREDRGARRLARREAVASARSDQAGRPRGGRGMEVEEALQPGGSGVVRPRSDLHR